MYSKQQNSFQNAESLNLIKEKHIPASYNFGYVKEKRMPLLYSFSPRSFSME